jgi:hypothetical protein
LGIEIIFRSISQAMKYRSILFIPALVAMIIGCLGCGPNHPGDASTSKMKALEDSIQTATTEFEEKNKSVQAEIHLKIGQEHERAGKLSSAKTTYEDAKAACSGCPLADSIESSIRRLALRQQPGPEDSLEAKIIGEHRFGVQFIWDGYGKATVRKELGEDWTNLYITGSQYSKDKQDYVLIDGEVTIQDDRHFTVDGTVKTNIKDCCGEINLTQKFRFMRSGARNFWRMQEPERHQFCDMYTCHYYIDFFMNPY